MEEQTENVVPDTVETPMPVEDERLTRLREEFGRVSIPSLQYFLEQLGYQADPETKKSDLIDAVVKIKESQWHEADKQVAEATALVASDDDPIVEMTFMNMESPGADHEFVYNGSKGFPKNEQGQTTPLPKWHFFPNRTYTVPLSVVNHLNSLKVQPDQVVSVNAEGFISNLYSGDTPKQNRFSCVVKFTSDQIRGLAVQKKG